MLFPFTILPEAGFNDYGPNVRGNFPRILNVLGNPCAGVRLRHPSGASSGEFRWDDFCKVDLSHGLRMVYMWDSIASVVAFGPHLAHGQLDNVYDAVAEMFDLPFDEGHAQLTEHPCCEDVEAIARTVTVDDGRRQILGMARRR